MFNSTKYVSAICMNGRISKSSYFEDGDKKSCSIRCHNAPNELDRSSNKPGKHQYIEHSLPDGVQCGKANSYHYCVRGRCEVIVWTKSHYLYNSKYIIR